MNHGIDNINAGRGTPAVAARGRKKIRVLIVDDSALIRQVLSAIVNAQDDMEVVATAAHPVMARDLLRSVEADVMTLDVEMPMMNGIDFLRRLMAARPMPVVMVSRPATMRRAVDLPHPDSPTSTRNSLSAISRLRS